MFGERIGKAAQAHGVNGQELGLRRERRERYVRQLALQSPHLEHGPLPRQPCRVGELRVERGSEVADPGELPQVGHQRRERDTVEADAAGRAQRLQLQLALPYHRSATVELQPNAFLPGAPGAGIEVLHADGDRVQRQLDRLVRRAVAEPGAPAAQAQVLDQHRRSATAIGLGGVAATRGLRRRRAPRQRLGQHPEARRPGGEALLADERGIDVDRLERPGALPGARQREVDVQAIEAAEPGAVDIVQGQAAHLERERVGVEAHVLDAQVARIVARDRGHREALQQPRRNEEAQYRVQQQHGDRPEAPTSRADPVPAQIGPAIDQRLALHALLQAGACIHARDERVCA